MQGFPALRKAVTTHVRYDIFHMCMTSPISYSHVTRLSHHSVRLMNERQTLHYFQSKVVCRNLFALWLLKHRKIAIAYRQWRSNLPRRKRNQNMKRKNRKLHIHVFGNGISRGWERESTTEWFTKGRFWPCTWKISSVGKDQFNN